MATDNQGPEKGSSQVGVGRARYMPSRRGMSSLKARLGSQIQDTAASLYQWAVVDLILRRKNVAASNGRHIPLAVEHDEPLIDARRGLSYVSNDIHTSRYSLWDFVPRQLFFQFSRVGNFYFLCVGIPQMVRATDGRKQRTLG